MTGSLPHNSFTEDATVEELQSQELIPPYDGPSVGLPLRIGILPRVQSLNLKRIEIPEVKREKSKGQLFNNTEIEERLNKLLVIVNGLKAKIESLQSDKNELGEELKEVKSDIKYGIKNLEEITEDLRDSINDLETDVISDFNNVDTKLDELKEKFSGLKEKLSELEEKVDEIEESPSEVVTRDELYSTAAELQEEIKNHLEVLRSRTDDHYVALNKELSSVRLSFQKETRYLKNQTGALFTDLDKKLSFNSSEHNNIQTKIVSLQTTFSSLAKENQELKEQVAELIKLRKSISSALSILGAIIVAIFIIFITFAVNE